ncbi:MAG TPA: DUF2127 domain-containing protein [Chthoniobacterales bacterium]|nr:DUF2127 domain-containing protein [Chthoniobacterales bacterium]
MSNPRPKTVRPERRIRYLKLIAFYEILKGFLLLVVGISLIFLNSRTQLLDRIGEWAGDELALVHSRAALYFLNGLQDVVSGGRLRFTGLVSLFYAVVLFVEGVGVYFQQRWAELLVILATATLIPFEAYHFWRHPGVVSAVVLTANCLIVWFLYRVLRREKREAFPLAKPTVAEVR